jgi:hypothetical protein
MFSFMQSTTTKFSHAIQIFYFITKLYRHFLSSSVFFIQAVKKMFTKYFIIFIF